MGFATSEAMLERRLDHHRAGSGARLMQVLAENGISFRLVRTWPDGDRSFERQLKTHSGTRYCPICRGPEALNSKPST